MNTMYATGCKSILWHLVNAVILTAFLYFVGIYPIDLLALQISGPHNTIIAGIIIEVSFTFLSWLILEASRVLESQLFCVQREAVGTFLWEGSDIIKNKNDLEAYTMNAYAFFSTEGIPVDRRITKEQCERFFTYSNAYIHRLKLNGASDQKYERAERLCMVAVEMALLCAVAVLFTVGAYFADQTAETIVRSSIAIAVSLLAAYIAAEAYKSAVKAWVCNVQAVYDDCVKKYDPKLNGRNYKSV